MDAEVFSRRLMSQALRPLNEADAARKSLSKTEPPEVTGLCQSVEVEVVHWGPCVGVHTHAICSVSTSSRLQLEHMHVIGLALK